MLSSVWQAKSFSVVGISVGRLDQQSILFFGQTSTTSPGLGLTVAQLWFSSCCLCVAICLGSHPPSGWMLEETAALFCKGLKVIMNNADYEDQKSPLTSQILFPRHCLNSELMVPLPNSSQSQWCLLPTIDGLKRSCFQSEHVFNQKANITS